MKRVLITLMSAALAAGMMLQAPQRVFAAVNDIYVGGSNDTTAASSCADPDFSTDLTDEGDINSALDAALAAVDDNGDTIIICDGDYLFADDITLHDGGPAHDVIVIEAAAGASVTLDGDGLYQIFSFDNVTSVSITGIDFYDAEAASGAAIKILDGSLTVTDSTFDSGDAFGSGSAIFANPGPVTVSDSDFTNNQNGDDAAIFVGSFAAGGQTVTVSDSSFSNNVSTGEGGAISVDSSGGALIEVSNSEFMNNDGRYGAIVIDGGTVELTGVLMDGNDGLDEDGGAVYAGDGFTATDSDFIENISGYGGAVYSGGPVTVTNSTFTGNEAESGEGGAIYADGGDVTITDSSFVGNFVSEPEEGGGAIYADGIDITLVDSYFSGNHAAFGGAVLFEGAAADVATVTGSRFSQNRATYEDDDMAADWGGAAIYLWGGSLEVDDSDFIGNSTPSTSAGAGIHVFVGSLYVDDSIFRGNRAGQGPAIYSYGDDLDYDETEEVVVTGSEFTANINIARDDSGAIAHERNGRDFIVTGNSFASNSGATYGGAIETWRVDGLTEITGNGFTGNSAREGGALWIDVRNGVADIHSNRFNRNRARTGGAISFECETDAPRTVTRLLSRSNRYSSNTASAPRSSANVWSSRYVDSAEDCN
jgi:predicted outer membrane repeat protein